MTTFQELQDEHERLLAQPDQGTEAAAYLQQVQDYIARVCQQAETIAASRDRDQLRANLRYWASYVYDRTGTYPNTTLRPALSGPGDIPPIPPPEGGHASVRRWQIIAGAVGALILFMVVIGRLALGPSLSFTPAPGQIIPTKIISGDAAALPQGTLHIDSKVITSGPSPFDPNIWAVRFQLSASGGDGYYIFWVNGQHLPDISQDQFTVEGKGCTVEHSLIGVTSGGQAISEELVISSPLPGCPAP